MSKLNLMIVAGEASGDGHGAKLVDALREAATDREYQFFGAAGPKLRAAGVDPVVKADELSIVGLPEIGRALPMFAKAFRDLRRSAVQRRPDAVILIDFPDFNLKLAKSLKKQGFTVIYYISPQLWAWRKYRIRSIKRYVDLVLTILPFEKDWYLSHGVEHIEYVGSPLAKEVHASSSKEVFCERHNLGPNEPIVALLPGSRHKEIVRILPIMLDAAMAMWARNSGIQFVVAVASSKDNDDIAETLAAKQAPNFKIPTVVVNETYDALHASDAAAITSGTATLEAGIIGTPMAIVYKTSPLNYRLLEPLIDVDHYGLINLIADQRIVTELIQDKFTPNTLADELLRLLEPKVNTAVRYELKQAADKLGHGGASKRAADAILRLIDAA